MFFKGTHFFSNLYDSHVHWLYSGQVAEGWNLKDISDPHQILKAEILPSYRRGNWINGFGWDENKWPQGFKLGRFFLDRISLDCPILLSRTDGHSSCVNTKALEILGFLKPENSHYRPDIEVDETGLATGILKESAHMKALFTLPDFSIDQKKKFLLSAADSFNRQGFTHIRDMTSSLEQWNLHGDLIDSPEFLLHVEHWFVCENIEALPDLIETVKNLKRQENVHRKLRGVKVFVDGSLGSHTAFLSKPYADQKGTGQIMWPEKSVKDLMRQCWKNKLELALHSLGDEASHLVVKWAREIYSEGLQGMLHLEHVEILRPETIQMMKSLHVRCHMQPCHWWSDQVWLQDRVPELFPMAFPWEALRKAQVPISFGSDAPIEPCDLFSNLKALENSAKAGIKKLNQNPMDLHCYPFADSLKGQTEILDDKIISVALGDRKKFFI